MRPATFQEVPAYSRDPWSRFIRCLLEKIKEFFLAKWSKWARRAWRDILWFAADTIVCDLSKYKQQRRLKTCFKALYFIPGAVRDLLAAHIPDEGPLFRLLPLLNSPESLEVIDKLWDEPNDDVVLSVRCVAAVVAAFIITPPRRELDHFFTTRYSNFIGDDDTGKQFLAKRLRVSLTADGGVAPEIHPNSDSARLQNIVRFLTDIKDAPQYEEVKWRSFDNSDSIRRERQKLIDQRVKLLDQYNKPLDQRHTEEFLDDLYPIIIPRGDRTSPDFVPAVQQDLIILTLEILARDPVTNAAKSQREAFYGAYMDLEQEMAIQARPHFETLTRTQTPTEVDVLSESPDVLEPSAQVQAPDFIQMIRRALDPIFQDLSAPQNAVTPSDDRASSLSMPLPENITPYDGHASSLPMPVPQITTAPSTVSLIFPYSTSPPARPSTAVEGLGDSQV